MLETILNRLAGDKGVKIERTSTGALLLRATGDTAFAPGSSSLSPRFGDFLRQLANGLQTYSTLSVKVTGHTDSTGDAQLNDRLSAARAAAAVNALVREGVASNRLLSEGKGQSEPIASNDSAEGRATNRRVDMLIIDLPRP
jgi:outer membrane protein OmpA-like peptidoglycan-associated protein